MFRPRDFGGAGETRVAVRSSARSLRGKVIAYPNPDRLGGRSKARKERRRKLAEIAF